MIFRRRKIFSCQCRGSSKTSSTNNTPSTSLTYSTAVAKHRSLSCVTDGSFNHKLTVKECERARRSFLRSLPQSLEERVQHKGKPDDVALFKPEEIFIGPKLGAGEFSDVYEVDSFYLLPEIKLSKDESKKRLHMKTIEKYHETGSSRYALKHIKVQYLPNNGDNAYILAASDLVLEAEFLSRLCHPNIIKLRGLAHSGVAGFAAGPCGYFLVIDRLTETLDQRIKQWHAKSEATKRGRRSNILTKRINSLPASSKSKTCVREVLKVEQKETKMIDECLSVALQISSAMKYLHSNSVIFRDLKPVNIGFDIRGDVKIFDFGLACTMPEASDHYNDAFEMSEAGSPRYMAPECLSGEDYNMKADVYTFAIVLWEMMSGKTPYNFVRNLDDLIYCVVSERDRPEIDERWPVRIKGIMESSFDAEMGKRPTMELIYNIIKGVLVALRGSREGLTDADINRRRSDASAHDVTAMLKNSNKELRVGGGTSSALYGYGRFVQSE